MGTLNGGVKKTHYIKTTRPCGDCGLTSHRWSDPACGHPGWKAKQQQEKRSEAESQRQRTDASVPDDAGQGFGQGQV
jgi:hypothetical protein